MEIAQRAGDWQVATNTHAVSTIRWVRGLATAAVCIALGGCASWTNPVANGIPVRLLPPELLAESKENRGMIPLTMLRQRPPEVYRLAPGDLLGIYVEGVLGKENEIPPVNFPESGNLPPSIGYPIPVREDGTLPLPLVDPIRVEGLSVPEAEQMVKKAYTVDREVLLTGEERVLVELIRPRQTRVLVIREDSPEGGLQVQTGGFRGLRGGNVIVTGRPRGTGDVLELPAYQNDVLTALARTGGLPGTDAVDAIVIQRGYADVTAGRDLGDGDVEAIASDVQRSLEAEEEDIIRIPLRLPEGQSPSFSPEDILLHEGDIVYVAIREPELYYTGGLLPSLEAPLPQDRDLNVLEAVARIGGPILNGGINSNNLSGGLVAPGIGNPSPSLLTVLRRTPGGGQVTIRVDLNRAMRDPRENILVQGGDVLLLQETPCQAFARYFTETFNFSIFSNVISRTDTVGTTSISVP